eukprot:gnl/Chilomastix_cuspidata/8288.p1 GENE.gnl/Chilomastix_cuspidata/8288~~gnl/Chilomastix_cuspidata/8288.p1  ORF type:complete len:365 (+),score=11.27 gnl/Chilomastix_cuspidata/8288:53-1096(+)
MIHLLNSKLEFSNKYLILVAENTIFDLEQLNSLNIEFVGAIVPEIIFDNKHLKEGLVIYTLNLNSQMNLIEDINNIDYLKKENFHKHSSFIIIVDGLSSYITKFLESTFQVLPLNSKIVGGGAGKSTLKQEPIIFSNSGIYQDSALIISMNLKLNIAVENGWQYLEGPFLVSSCDKNCLKSLNFSKAFKAYKEVIEKDCKIKITKDNFLDVCKSYPLGIIKFDEEIIVRDPIFLDEDENIILIGDIEQNSTINILKGNKEYLLNASKNIVNKACKNIQKDDIQAIAIFDCISRSSYLGKDFVEELNHIKKQSNDKLIFGALSLGEIANNGNEYINLYNKTCVVGVLC